MVAQVLDLHLLAELLIESRQVFILELAAQKGHVVDREAEHVGFVRVLDPRDKRT